MPDRNKVNKLDVASPEVQEGRQGLGKVKWTLPPNQGLSSLMNRPSFVVLIDVQSIKKFVFGTDALSEVRGASALLDWLNQVEMERCLRDHPGMDSDPGGDGLCQRRIRSVPGARRG